MVSTNPTPDTPVSPPARVAASDREVWSLRLKMPAWLRDNPGLALTVAYVAASVIGLLYNFLFFRRFGINVLEFSEASDFLMVVVREPLTVAMALSGILVYVVYVFGVRKTTEWVYRCWPRLKPSEEKRLKNQAKFSGLVRVIQVAFISVYAFLFVQLYSNRQARLVREAPKNWVTIDYKTDAPATLATGEVKAVLLGTTARFVFLYRPETKRAEAIQLDAIARLSWDARTRRERAADAEKK